MKRNDRVGMKTIMNKKWYLLLASLIMLAGCSQASDEQKASDLKIVVASDIHYLTPEYYKDCDWFEDAMLEGDGKMVTYADEILDAFQKDMEKQQPQFVILTGDLTFNGEKESHRDLAEKLKQLEKQGITVAVLPGNHDLDSLLARKYHKDGYDEVDSVSAKEFKEIYQELGYDQAGSYDEHSLSSRMDLNKQYSLFMLDSVAHEQKGTAMAVGGFLSDSTWEWLERQLQELRKEGKKAIVAMHHNLTEHFPLLDEGYAIDEYEKLADCFQEYGVPFVLSGHMHCQHISEQSGVYDIASASLVDAPLQYGVITLHPESMDYQTHSLTISTDADAYFDQVSRNKLKKDFAVIEDEAVREAMLDVVVRANRYFFAGNLGSHLEECKQMEGYSYYGQEQGNALKFPKYYLAAMMQDAGDYQSLHIDFDK